LWQLTDRFDHWNPSMPRHTPSNQRSVLIVDDKTDSREVLRAVLEMRGWNIIEADDASEGLEKADLYRPDVIVLDVDALSAENEAVQARYDAASQRNDASLVVIGQARYAGVLASRRRNVAKPYHYAPLVRTIDELATRVLAKAS
jgi:response regulator RpfG family c-di-GMP phosphodiesterase